MTSSDSILADFLTNLDSDVYCIENLKPEIVAVLFAYISRSPNSIKENILTFLEDLRKAGEKSADFHEKWVIGFGHSSVAEHADIKIALENCSIVASKVIEDARLGSYTEKSTRYQKLTRDRVYSDEVIQGSSVRSVYEGVCDELFVFYQELSKKLTRYFKEKFPGSKKVFIRSKVLDVARMALPAGTQTKIGISWNARVARQALVRMLSHELPEIRHLGKAIKGECEKICPTLMKHTVRSPYRESNKSHMVEFDEFAGMAIFDAGKTFSSSKNSVDLVFCTKDAVNELCTAVLYKTSTLSYSHLFRRVSASTVKTKEMVIDTFFSSRGDKEAPLRELESIQVTSEFFVDYGAYRDIQRHRMCSQYPKGLTVSNGYVEPPEINEVGMRHDYRDAMESAYHAFYKIRKVLPGYEQYVIPLAYIQDTLFMWNLREVFHFIELRSKETGHVSYRRLAVDLYDQLNMFIPQIMKWCRVTRRGL